MLHKGIYKHFKGNFYELVSVMTNADTGEQIVTYKPYGWGEDVCYFRPLAEFDKEFEEDEYPQYEQRRRFQFICSTHLAQTFLLTTGLTQGVKPYRIKLFIGTPNFDTFGEKIEKWKELNPDIQPVILMSRETCNLLLDTSSVMTSYVGTKPQYYGCDVAIYDALQLCEIEVR